MVHEIFNNLPAMLLLTIGAYLLGVWLRRKSGIALLHPFVISIPVIIAVIKLFDISPEFYIQSNSVIDFMLGPSVVSLGIRPHMHIANRVGLKDRMLIVERVPATGGRENGGDIIINSGTITAIGGNTGIWAYGIAAMGHITAKEGTVKQIPRRNNC